MAKYESYAAKRSITDGAAVWAYAYTENSQKEGMALKQHPIRGIIVNPLHGKKKFIPFKKNSDTELAMSKAVHIDSRDYADTEAEAWEGYNSRIDRLIEWYRKKITELESEKQ